MRLGISIGVPGMPQVASAGSVPFAPSQLVGEYGGAIFDARESSTLTITSSPDLDAWAASEGFATYGSLVQSVAGDKPHVITDSGLTLIEFDDGPNQFLESDQAASVWGWLHKAEGASVYMVGRQMRTQDRTWLATAGGPSDTGLYMNAGAGIMAVAIYNGSGTNTGQAIPDGFVLGQLHVIEARHHDVWGLRARRDDAAEGTSGNVKVATNAAYSSADPTNTLLMGTRPDQIIYLDGDIVFLAAFEEPLNNEDEVAMRAWLGAEFGTAAIGSVGISGSYPEASGTPDLVLAA